jgi:hypothetical protein
MAREWRCPEPGCAYFGPQRTAGQPPPRLRAGVPTCARHEQRLADAGARPASVVFAARVDGVIRQRFPVTAKPIAVGRDPSEPGAVCLGPWLPEQACLRVSRSHVVLSLGSGGVQVVDTSTNGTVVRGTVDTRLSRGDSHVLGEMDTVELHEGVELARATRWRNGGVANPLSVMVDAPTVALRLPPS